jgi:hypothetical protein
MVRYLTGRVFLMTRSGVDWLAGIFESCSVVANHMSAETTNALTNALHAIFLFLYLTGSTKHYIRNNKYFTGWIVTFFLILFVLKLMGVYVHYYPSKGGISNVWIAISLLVVFLNYVVVHGMETPNIFRSFTVLISLLFSFLFIVNGGGFVYLALPLTLIYLAAAYYSRGLLRLGFLLVVASNVIWITAREIASFWVGNELPVHLRFDNDVYHLMLIGSTLIIYQAILRGYWANPSEGMTKCD